MLHARSILITRDCGYCLTRGSNIGVAGCGIGHEIEEGCGIWEILEAEYGMKLSWGDRDALISIGGMRDSFEIDSGMRDLNSKWPFENLTRRDRYKDSESGEMTGWNQNLWRDAGFKRPIFTVVCCYGWKGQKWIETWKCWPILSSS